MANLTALEKRIEQLESREMIKELVAHYGIAIDNRDMDSLTALFTVDAGFSSKDGMLNACGIDAIIEQFHARFAGMGPSNHFVHEHIIRFDDTAAGKASGLVTSHVELVRDSEPMLVALRYEDKYRYDEQTWRFSDRLISIFYYMKVTDYVRCLGEPERMRAYEKPQVADYPESLVTWKNYYTASR